jgi:hypothetical protein
VTWRWTTPDDVTRFLRRRWDRGELLRHLATGQPWEPLRVPIRAPTPAELGSDLGAARDWADAWQRTTGAARVPRVRLGTRRVGGRLVGANSLPCEAWFDTAEQAWRWLGVGSQVTAYQRILDGAKAGDERLGQWVGANPMRALAHAEHWDPLQRTVLQLRAHVGSGGYLRELDVPGVDTKFAEAHWRLVAELLDVVTGDAGGLAGSRSVEHFGFAGKPKRIRLRSLDGLPLLPGVPHLTDLTVRVDELATVEIGAGPVLIAENEVTFLALPALPGVTAYFGAGFDVLRLGQVPWLASGDRPVVYWGDLDTHGFVILDRLRGLLPDVRSVLMDQATLLAHRAQWVTESRPSREVLRRLTQDESHLYADLVGDVYGPAVRLEQERVERAWAIDALCATFARMGLRQEPFRGPGVGYPPIDTGHSSDHLS